MPQGVHADPEKVKAIMEMPAPSDKKGVEWLITGNNKLSSQVHPWYVHENIANPRFAQERHHIWMVTTPRQEIKQHYQSHLFLLSMMIRYAQIEKELLVVVFAFQKFHQYMYGKEAHVESDHKLLEMIVKKPLAEAPPRLQCMLLQLQKYSFDLKFKPGKEMVLADTLSHVYIIEDPV